MKRIKKIITVALLASTTLGLGCADDEAVGMPYSCHEDPETGTWFWNYTHEECKMPIDDLACPGDCSYDDEGDVLEIKFDVLFIPDAPLVPQAEDCSNQVDDDLDEYTDCFDDDCAEDPACVIDPKCPVVPLCNAVLDAEAHCPAGSHCVADPDPGHCEPNHDKLCTCGDFTCEVGELCTWSDYDSAYLCV